MTVIVNSGSTVTVGAPGFALTATSTIASGGLFDGFGTVTGAFPLLDIGTISADSSGNVFSFNIGSLTNSGVVEATNNGTLVLQSGVDVTNLTSGTLSLGVWQANGTGQLEILGGSVVTDDATITLNGASAVIESGASPQSIDDTMQTIDATGVLNLQNGASFTALATFTVDGDLNLAGGSISAENASLVVGANGVISGFGTLDPNTSMDDEGLVEASGGTLSVADPFSVTGAGTLMAAVGASLQLQAFGGSYAETIVNNGTVDASFFLLGGTLDVAEPLYSGSGSFLIQGGPDAGDRAVLELGSGVSGNVAFDPNFGVLLLDDETTFNGTVDAFGDNSELLLGDVSNAATAGFAGGELILTDSSGGTVATVAMNSGPNTYSIATFSVMENIANNKATVTVTGVECFATGTRIKTPGGDVPVERLAAGDLVDAMHAGATRVVFVGHRHVICRRHPSPASVWPVLVRAHAFAPRMPERDLLLSPDHAVYVDGVLIPVKHLINGKTITQTRVDSVTYYHIELAEHDILFAEGMPAESYLEIGNRRAFDNAGGLIALHPDFGERRWEAFGCADLVVTGPQLDQVTARLAARAPRQLAAARAIA